VHWQSQGILQSFKGGLVDEVAEINVLVPSSHQLLVFAPPELVQRSEVMHIVLKID